MTDERSNWERTDSALSGLGNVARGTGNVMVRAYGLGLIAFGIFIIVALESGFSWAALAIIAYGVYLLFGGSWVVY